MHVSDVGKCRFLSQNEVVNHLTLFDRYLTTTNIINPSYYENKFWKFITVLHLKSSVWKGNTRGLTTEGYFTV